MLLTLSFQPFFSSCTTVKWWLNKTEYHNFFRQPSYWKFEDCVKLEKANLLPIKKIKREKHHHLKEISLSLPVSWTPVSLPQSGVHLSLTPTPVAIPVLSRRQLPKDNDVLEVRHALCPCCNQFYLSNLLCPWHQLLIWPNQWEAPPELWQHWLAKFKPIHRPLHMRHRQQIAPLAISFRRR